MNKLKKSKWLVRTLAILMALMLLLGMGIFTGSALAASEKSDKKTAETSTSENKAENNSTSTKEKSDTKDASGKETKSQEELWKKFAEKVNGSYLLEKDDKESAALSFFTAFGNLFLDEIDLKLDTKTKKQEISACKAGEVYPVTVEEDSAVVRIWWFSDEAQSGTYQKESGATYTILLDEDGLLIEGDEDTSLDGVALLDEEVPVSSQYKPDAETVKQKTAKASALPKGLIGTWEYLNDGMEYRLAFQEDGSFAFLRKAEESPAEYYEGTAFIKDDMVTFIAAKLGSGQKSYEAEFTLKWEEDSKKTELSLKNPSGKTGSIPVYNKKKGTYKRCEKEQEALLMSMPTDVDEANDTTKAGQETAPAKENTDAKSDNKGSAETEKETKPSGEKETTSSQGKDNTQKGADDQTKAVVYTSKDIQNLKNTKIFLASAIKHIFLGEINKSGVGTGYHYDGIVDSPGKIIEGTKTAPDERGVYTGKVEVDGVKKTGNRGYSTFYPESMSPQEVVDAINEAYKNRELISGNLYAGLTKDGMEIDMALTDDGKIITAYPIKED